MKKILCFLLSLTMLLSMVSCTNGDNETTTQSSTTENSTTESSTSTSTSENKINRITKSYVVEKINFDMAYEQVVSILGKPQKETNVVIENLYIYEWDCANDERLNIKFAEKNGEFNMSAIQFINPSFELPNTNDGNSEDYADVLEHNPNPEKLLAINEALKIEIGMSYTQVVSIIGYPQETIGSGIISKHWYLDNGWSMGLLIDLSEHGEWYVTEIVFYKLDL